MRNRKLIALLLSVLMVLGTVALPAFAEEAVVEEAVVEEIAEETVEETVEEAAEEIAEEVAVEETAAEEDATEEIVAEETEEEEVTLSDVTVVYVSASGSDDNDGTSRATAVATVNKAASLLTNGAGTINIIDGTLTYSRPSRTYGYAHNQGRIVGSRRLQLWRLCHKRSCNRFGSYIQPLRCKYSRSPALCVPFLYEHGTQPLGYRLYIRSS